MGFLGSIYGGLAEVNGWLLFAGLLAGFLALGYSGASFKRWSISIAAAMVLLGAPFLLWLLFAGFVMLFGMPSIRRQVLTSRIVDTLNKLKLMPVISETEQTAIEAGNIWIDGELFSGNPDFKRILNESYPRLTDEEQAFLDGPVEKICEMSPDWEVIKNKELSKETWDYIKEQRFFGLIIPKEYGGLGFSALAHSAVIAKLSTRCGGLTTTVMVPNSLGPAELLLHYGTKEQKDKYLPRLARAEEIPCFALTEPGAGSDAGAMTSRGVVFKDENGELFLRLNWKKRYITLAGISTLLGVAFKLSDPDNLLGKGKSPGITCALIPADTQGVVLGRRHDPLGVPFWNCPTEGHDVVVPIDAIIGGAAQAGNGWRMLMESLAVGRGISLPASATGGTRYVARVLGAYTTVRKQFGLSIGKFEGIEEPMARVGGWAYMLEAARIYTCGGLDAGQKPPVVTAMAKYSFTEILRKAVNDGMDVLGGAAISRGPRNLLSTGYMTVPINITVEGANILTRTLMVFGQGAIRCHPYAFKEIQALMNKDLIAFDNAFWPHIGHVIRNACRALVLSLSRGHLAQAPVNGPTAIYYKKLSWVSASFAFLADVAMGMYGGNLKRKEKLTGRFADIFSYMYLASATLRRFEAEGRKKEDLPFVEWALQYSLSEIQSAFDGLYENMGFPFSGPIAFWSRMNPISGKPSDALGGKVAQLLQKPGEQRDRVTNGTYLPQSADDGLGRLENAFSLSIAAAPIARKVLSAVKAGKLQKARMDLMVKAAVEAKIISADDAQILAKAEEARTDAIQVDSFTQEEYLNGAGEAAPRRSTLRTKKEPSLN